MRTVWLIIVGLFLALVAFSPTVTGAEQQKTGEPQSITKDTACQIKGMEGGCCTGKIESSLLKVKGIKAVTLDKKAGTARITLDNGAKVSVPDIKKAIKEADKKHNHGFEVVSIKETGKQTPQK